MTKTEQCVGFLAVCAMLSLAATMVAMSLEHPTAQRQSDLQHAKTVLKQLSYNCADRLRISYTAEQMTVECVR